MTSVSRANSTSRSSQIGEPVWELAELYPRQGTWSEADYLELDSNRLIEFTHGVLEFLPRPKLSHARIARYLSDLLRVCGEMRGLGDVLWAPTSIRLRPGILREPDVLWLRPERTVTNDVPDGADLVIEIVSGDSKDRRRDSSQKHAEYATAGIPEYWIVDPRDETITVLTLPAGAAEYAVHGEFHRGHQATSVMLPEFVV